MTATNKKIQEQEPGEIEALLPWHAAGTLSARDSRRVEDALARDGELAKQYAVIQEEYAETIALNESLGAPSSRAMAKLFAAIDAEPVRKPSASLRISAGIGEFFSSLSPRTVAFSAARRNRLDMSVSIALGSASQIALFVAPVLVLLSYAVGPKPMDLQFWPGAIVMMMIAAITAGFITNGGRSAWFIGVLLLLIYAIFAMTLYVMPPGVHGPA